MRMSLRFWTRERVQSVFTGVCSGGLPTLSRIADSDEIRELSDWAKPSPAPDDLLAAFFEIAQEYGLVSR